MGGSGRHALCSNHKVLIGERGASDLKSTVIAPLCVLDLTVGDAAAQLGNLNAMGIIGPQSGRDQVAAWNHQRQGD